MGTFGTWSDSDQPAHLIMAPYRSHTEVRDYPRSRIVEANCGHWAWLSPAGEPYLTRCYTICADCAAGLVTTADRHLAVKGALDDLRRQHGDAAADQVAQLMDRAGMVEDE